ncbi:hypothetical protein [Shewanella surugensis]|uniref:Uncharacterized protein n=1 Tax=Shewanella surugensis TaxID=212020 RepID=A0ABT0LAU3_9GAMM|nr:hypothetical protein [Shewanella surugensis]MCL1124689.1 hypothetical protein [Shewanella surugensis]
MILVELDDKKLYQIIRIHKNSLTFHLMTLSNETDHKKKQLKAQLWRIIGVGEIIDITEEVILSYPELQDDK